MAVRPSPHGKRVSLLRLRDVTLASVAPPQFPPIFQAIARVAAVAAPIVGRALVDAYKQAMISTGPPTEPHVPGSCGS